METRILWQSDSLWEHNCSKATHEQREQIFAGMLQEAQRVARPDTQFVLNFPTASVGRDFVPAHRFNRAYMAVEIMERIKQAEEDGFDAAFAGTCYGEFFLNDARQAVSIPVVGPAESSMVFAQALGGKFAVVTVTNRLVQQMEHTIRLHGWEDRAIRNQPVRAWDADMSPLVVGALEGRPERLIEEFEKVALESVRDGADVVICGCLPYGAALSQVGYNEVGNTGVPVITALPAMIKFAESLVDLRRSLGITKSEALRSPYRSTPEETLRDMEARGIRSMLPRVADRAFLEAYGASQNDTLSPS
ncbi:aspartate/glutamate racemase family protein [Pseudarthrobacter sp. fls2-241-R2A-168]|uniref:aspartate/glutamate racemase family protein n=1 Tax=Pseudarthrobacter sp. fls2-241-R2A-168 TaxID=3040304 RepID=UPI002552FD6D|nr:aspartate/glutamate racemase family protein [Pseudarthrobacter sp. fls2-241-R2A-168]